MAQVAGRLKSIYKIPGGHAEHSSVPLEVILENVPKGHGRKYANLESADDCRNPDAIMSDIILF